MTAMAVYASDSSSSEPKVGSTSNAMVAATDHNDRIDISTSEVQTIKFRQEVDSDIKFDDTRLGDVYITRASGIERFVNLTHREDGRKEYAIVGLANLFEILPAAVGEARLEISNATLTLSSKYDLGIGSSISVHPITSEWLTREPGKNQTEPSVNSNETWKQPKFGPADFDNNHATTTNWTAGKNTIDVTMATKWMYETGLNQGFAVVANAGPHGGDADILMATSDHWEPTERPELKISFRYTTNAASPIVDDQPGISTDLKILSETIPNSANPAIPLTRYYSEDPDLTTLSHNQSGELTGFSPDGKWQHMLVGFENWYLRNTETGEIKFAHKTYQGASTQVYFQWTVRNNYLRFESPGVLEEVDPSTRHVVNSAQLTVAESAPTPDQTVDYVTFSLGESSGADGIYVYQLASFNGQTEERRFINVIDTSNGAFREQYFYEFDEAVHNGDSTQNRWKELFLTNNTFVAHVHPFGRPGTGSTGVGGDIHYTFPTSGDGSQWKAATLTEQSGVLSELQSHRSLETIDGVIYIAYSVWRGPTNFLVVAEQESGNEILSLPIGDDRFAHHIHFFENEIVYSVLSVDMYSNLTVEAVTVDVNAKTSGPQRIIANVGTTITSFDASARPFTDAQGTYCWHTNEFSNGDVVDLVCAETDFDPTEPKQTSQQGLFTAFLALSRELLDRKVRGLSTFELVAEIGELIEDNN